MNRKNLKKVPKSQKIALSLILIVSLLFAIFTLFCDRSGTLFTPFYLLIALLFVVIIVASCLYSLNQTHQIGWKHILYLLFAFTVLIAYFFLVLPITAKLGMLHYSASFIIYELLQVIFAVIFLVMVKNTPLK